MDIVSFMCTFRLNVLIQIFKLYFYHNLLLLIINTKT